MSSRVRFRDQTHLFLQFLDYIADEQNLQINVLMSTVIGTAVGSRFGTGENSTWWGMVGGAIAGIATGVCAPKMIRFLKENMTEEQRRELAGKIAVVFGNLGFVFRDLNHIVRVFTTDENAAKRVLTEIVNFLLPLMV